MYRETDRGLRYYVKENGRRVVSDQPTNHAKALAMGVTLDPSYAFPLPIFGINYLNFQFGSPNTQLGAAVRRRAGGRQHPALEDRHDAPRRQRRLLRDRGAVERSALRTGRREPRASALLTWPLSTGLNLGWQATPFQKATLQYQFRFDGYVRDRTTAENFVVPSSTVTHGIGGAWEYRRGGYSRAANGTWFGRAVVAPWGARERRWPRRRRRRRPT